jgi:hypothetical protein
MPCAQGDQQKLKMSNPQKQHKTQGNYSVTCLFNQQYLNLKKRYGFWSQTAWFQILFNVLFVQP